MVAPARRALDLQSSLTVSVAATVAVPPTLEPATLVLASGGSSFAGDERSSYQSPSTSTADGECDDDDSEEKPRSLRRSLEPAQKIQRRLEVLQTCLNDALGTMQQMVNQAGTCVRPCSLVVVGRRMEGRDVCGGARWCSSGSRGKR